MVKIKNCIYLPKTDKQIVSVGFPKCEIKEHKGIAGLKYYLVVMYLRKHVQTFGQVSLTLNNLLQECGYSTRSNNKSIYFDFREIVKTEIINKGYAECNTDILTVKPNDLFYLQLSYENSIFFSSSCFVQATISEYEKICSIESNVNKSVLFGVYLYIKQFIVDNTGDSSIPKISFPSKAQISKGLNVSIPTVENSIRILEENKIIYVRTNIFMKHKNIKDQYVPTRNVFALNPYELEKEGVLIELEKIYGEKVYDKNEISGKTSFLTKSRRCRKYEM